MIGCAISFLILLTFTILVVILEEISLCTVICQYCYKVRIKSRHTIWNKKDGCKANAIPITEITGIN